MESELPKKGEEAKGCCSSSNSGKEKEEAILCGSEKTNKAL